MPKRSARFLRFSASESPASMLGGTGWGADGADEATVAGDSVEVVGITGVGFGGSTLNEDKMCKMSQCKLKNKLFCGRIKTMIDVKRRLRGDYL